MKTIKITFYFFFGIAVGLLISDCCACNYTSQQKDSTASTESIEPLPQPSEQKNSFEKPVEQVTQSVNEIPVAASSPEDTLQRWATREGLMEVSQDDALTNKTPPSSVEPWDTRQGLMEVSGNETQDETRNEKPPTGIQKWGTREGVIEVAALGKAASVQLVKKMQAQRALERKANAARVDQLRKFEIVQVALINTSGVDRDITLGGDAISPPLVEDVQDHSIIASATTGIHPQGVIGNPVNDLVYVANQLSDSVTVATLQGDVITTIKLRSTLPGTNSPVALAVHSLVGRPDYGKVYVVGSVANRVSVINAGHAVTNEIPTGVRPVAIAFHPLNEMLYVANFASGNVTVIDVTSERVVTILPVRSGPRAVSVNPDNGDIYIANSGDNSITVYDRNHHLKASIAGAGIAPVSLTWHPGLHMMYVVAAGSAQLIPVRADYTLGLPVPVGQKPYGLLYNPANNFLYIADQGNNLIHILNEQNIAQSAVSANGVTIGFAIHPHQNILLYTSPFSSAMEIVGYAPSTRAVQIDEKELSGIVNYFRYNPARIEHVKFIVSGDQGIKNLTVLEKSVRGKKTERSIALTNYQSPQHFQKVYEVDALKKVMLDGHTQWHFALPANQAATILVYYTPLEKTKAYKNLYSQFINQTPNA